MPQEHQSSSSVPADHGFTDSPKSFLQTLEEFAVKLQLYDQNPSHYDKQTQIIDDFFHITSCQGEPAFVDYTKYQKTLYKLAA